MIAGYGGSTMALMRNALLRASRNPWLASTFPKYRFARAAARRFMPGTTVDAALDAAATLASQRISAVLTQLGENVANAGAADAVVEHYLDVLELIGGRGLDAQVSIKLTQLGLDIGDDVATRNLIALVERAAARGNVVWVDMEDSSYVDRTLAVFLAALDRHPNVGICLQSYLRRTDADLDALLDRTTAVRLVKGAYREPPSVAFPDKRTVDENYFRLACRLIEAAQTYTGQPSPVIGTHDVGLIARIAAHADAANIDRGAWEIDMLYGIRSADQARLAAAGHAVRVLISYGEEWFPWYVRRLAERPANVWFVVRSLFSR